MFIDELVLNIEAGSGGDGVTSFRREKFVPLGGPDGGNGGRGSNIVFKVDKNLKTLIDLKYQKTIKGKNGEKGQGKNKYGRNAKDVFIKVPEGTIISDADTGLIICDLIEDKEEYIVATGGRGGRGNKAFATNKNKAPRISENGEPGEKRKVKLELKVLADVGIIGFPNVGKSTLLSQVSSSKPKIAAYHFTTLSPNLGVIKLKDDRSFVMADLPGLIEGAHTGKGLGKEFLKHTARTRILLHVIDISGSEERDPIEDYEIIRNELKNYSEKLYNKKEIIVLNKIDLDTKDNVDKFKEKYKNKEIFQISALNNEFIDELLIHAADTLDSIDKEELHQEEEFEHYMIYKFKEEKPFTITKVDTGYKISGDDIERLVKMTKFEEDEAVDRFMMILRKMGIYEELEKLDIQPGEDIHILDKTFIYKDWTEY